MIIFIHKWLRKGHFSHQWSAQEDMGLPQNAPPVSVSQFGPWSFRMICPEPVLANDRFYI
jgi:hypothetical protein